MKRAGNLYQQVCSFDNLKLAEQRAIKGKLHQPSVQEYLQQRGCNMMMLHYNLVTKNYKTSPYSIFKICEPKERIIHRLPFCPDRIVHHAIMNVIEALLVAMFTADTYSCIKGRGIHAAQKAVELALKDVPGTRYCLKMDIKKFYPSVDHAILKAMLRRKIKDNDLLWLLDEIIDSAAGLPIGNYLSQYLANFYLTYCDHWLKEEMRLRYYFRYADDMVILSDSKEHLHKLCGDISLYLANYLNLTVKDNYQVFPLTKERGLDFVGYVFYHTHTLLRKSIKQNMARAVKKRKPRSSIASYMGWAKHCDSKNLIKKLLPHYEQFQGF